MKKKSLLKSSIAMCAASDRDTTVILGSVNMEDEFSTGKPVLQEILSRS